MVGEPWAGFKPLSREAAEPGGFRGGVPEPHCLNSNSGIGAGKGGLVDLPEGLKGLGGKGLEQYVVQSTV